MYVCVKWLMQENASMQKSGNKNTTNQLEHGLVVLESMLIITPDAIDLVLNVLWISTMHNQIFTKITADDIKH